MALQIPARAQTRATRTNASPITHAEQTPATTTISARKPTFATLRTMQAIVKTTPAPRRITIIATRTLAPTTMRARLTPALPTRASRTLAVSIRAALPTNALRTTIASQKTRAMAPTLSVVLEIQITHATPPTRERIGFNNK